MMAAVSNKFPAWFVALVSLSLLVSGASSAAGNISQSCVDGTYVHGGRICCLCGAGLYLEKHCTTNLATKCQTCDGEMYSSLPNNQDACEPCTSCSQPNANLEVDQPCTPARDTKCRCKKDHYCSSETCKICSPCKECGAEGIKVACTANNNTVCKEKNEGGDHVGIIVGITVTVFVIVILALACFWKKRRNQKRKRTFDILTNGADVEMQLLQDVDVQRHLPAIAEAIKWKDLRDVAIKDGITDPGIESCQLNHPGDAQEQKLELLKIIVEKEGKEAPRKLIQLLEKGSKKGTAEKVKKILYPQNLPA